jgi:hypothetical protein
MSTTVVAQFEDLRHADQVVSDLVTGGVSPDAISVITLEGTRRATLLEHSAAVAFGTTAGTALGALLGLFLILAARALSLTAALLARAPLAAVLLCVGLGALFCGVAGGMLGLQRAAARARRLAPEVERGGTMVTVQADDEDVHWIERLMNRDGATDIAEREPGWSPAPPTAERRGVWKYRGGAWAPQAPTTAPPPPLANIQSPVTAGASWDAVHQATLDEVGAPPEAPPPRRS